MKFSLTTEQSNIFNYSKYHGINIATFLLILLNFLISFSNISLRGNVVIAIMTTIYKKPLYTIDIVSSSFEAKCAFICSKHPLWITSVWCQQEHRSLMAAATTFFERKQIFGP